MFRYIILMLGITVLLSLVVPVAQYLYYSYIYKNRPNKMLFSQSLFDYDLENLRFEALRNSDAPMSDRQMLSNRGWVRYPNGTIISNSVFEDKKREEYAIELP